LVEKKTTLSISPKPSFFQATLTIKQIAKKRGDSIEKVIRIK
jgi:hypothetical protein